MDSLYYCTKCGKPLHVYNNKVPNDKVCTCCCQIHKKLPVPEKYIDYIYESMPTFNDELSEEFVNEILKRAPIFDESLSWFKRKDELKQKQSENYQKIKAVQQQAANVPKCPTCQSTNIRRMGGVERGASIWTFGLFSKKINKTFKCNNCGYTW